MCWSVLWISNRLRCTVSLMLMWAWNLDWLIDWSIDWSIMNQVTSHVYPPLSVDEMLLWITFGGMHRGWHFIKTAPEQADIFDWGNDSYWCWTCSPRNFRANREGSRPLLAFHLWMLYHLPVAYLACSPCLRSFGNASALDFSGLDFGL